MAKLKTSEILLKVVPALVVLLIALYCVTLGREAFNRFLQWVQAGGPLVFYAMFAALTSLGVPPVPFLIVAGATFSLFTNVLGVLLAYSVSLAFGYWMTGKLYRTPLERFLDRSQFPIRRIAEKNSLELIVLVRLTPGFPYVLQNCLLATLVSRFWQYFIVSLPVAAGMALLYIAIGNNSVAGRRYMLVAVVTAIIGIGLLLRWKLRRWSEQA